MLTVAGGPHSVVIRDQRHVYAGRDLNTVAEVVATWDALLAERSAAEGKPVQRWRTNRSARARIDWGRWVIDCTECGDAPIAWADNPEACCIGCGAVYDVEFPATEERLKAEAVLSSRRYPANRSWDPQHETVADLQAENILMDDRPADFRGITFASGGGRRLGPEELLGEHVGRFDAAIEDNDRRALGPGR